MDATTEPNLRDLAPAALVERLSADPRIQLAYVFGSRAHGTARADSDLDLGISLGQRLDWDAQRLLRADLADACAPTTLDLVFLDDASSALLYEVITGGHCIVARDLDAQAEFEIVGLSRFMDFEPVRRVQDAYRRARLEARRGPA